MASTQSEVREPIAGSVAVDTRLGPRVTVRCACGHELFNGVAVRSRVVRVLPDETAEAMCRCKQWLKVPLVYSAAPLRRAGQQS